MCRWMLRAAYALLCLAVALPPALADDPPPTPSPDVGFIGFPEFEGADLRFFLPHSAGEAETLTKLANEAVKRCDRASFERRKAELLRARELVLRASRDPRSDPTFVRRLQADADNMQLAYDRIGNFDDRCPAAKSIEAIMEFFLQGGLSIPFQISSSVTSNEPGFPSQTALGSSSYGLPNFGAGVRVNVLRVNPSIFLETRFQTAFGSTAFSQTFAQPTFGTAPFGQNTIRENWGIPILLGASVPLGQIGNTAFGADFYGGITISNWSHSLRGGEAAVPGGGPGFGTGQNRTSVDPTFGVGLKMPSLDITGDGRGDLILGLYAEFAFRQASTVTAGSTAFPGVTYNGTADAHTNTSIMFRVGIPFGGPGPLFRRD